jgi:hypothetical protein
MCYKTVMVSYKNGTITKRYSYKTVHYKTVHRHYGVTQYNTVAIKRVPPTHGLVGLQPNLT